MSAITPSVRIEGVDTDYLEASYQNTGGLKAATLQFKLPLSFDGYRKLWNKEVTCYLNDFDSVPVFRGWIKRIKENFDEIEIYAQDALGYMVLGGDPGKAKIALTADDNLDGLTVGNAIRKAISKAQLSTKIGTDIIGDTTPSVSSSNPPLRGTLGVLDIIKTLISRAVDNSGDTPRPNIARLVDDGTVSQLIIELESDVSTGSLAYTFSEETNITNLKIINRKIPTVIIVDGLGEATGTYVHSGALAAYDRNYLEVKNESLKSNAECVDFAQKLFRANLENQFEYGIETFEGAGLSENNVIRINTDNPNFSGNYRVRGKKMSFTPSSFSVGLTINKQPPTLAEYIYQQDN